MDISAMQAAQSLKLATGPSKPVTRPKALRDLRVNDVPGVQVFSRRKTQRVRDGVAEQNDFAQPSVIED